MNLKVNFLVIALAASLVGCGSDSDSSNTNVSDSIPPEITNPNPDPNPDPVPNPSFTSNILGDALNRGYAGSYSLTCEQFVALGETKTINRTLTIDASGIKINGDTLYNNNDKGSIQILKEDVLNHDAFLITPPEESKYSLSSISYDEDLRSEIITISEKANNDFGSIGYTCPVAFSNPSYFANNIGNILSKYVDEPLNVECIDYATPRDLITLNGGPKTNRELYIDDNNSLHVDDMVYYGSDFKNNNFLVLSFRVLDSDNKFQNQFTSTNEVKADSPNSDQKRNSVTVFFDGDDKFTALTISTPDTQGIRTCGPR